MQAKICCELTGFLKMGVVLVMVPILATSCMTTYDAYGNPQQTVDPGVAMAGVAAAGVLGYALANDNDYSSRSYYRSSGYYGNRSCGSGYGNYSGYGGGYRRSYSGYGRYNGGGYGGYNGGGYGGYNGGGYGGKTCY
jgi:hypothetical protein